ncbi:MAG: sulfite exporter TauE/SafE family protein, partial [Candidatus Lernaella stagnicola]|nr:sulfite exporter TauE/SafE family protein [Candidatus Lernaella stagnicola]
MLKIAGVSLIFFALAVLMTMTGRGGGNFYVLTLVLAGLPMHEAATTGQFVLFTTAAAATLIFKKGKALSVPLALFLAALTASMAFTGGFLAHLFSGRELKIVFSILLALAGTAMFFTVEENKKKPNPRRGYWNLKSGKELFVINLWLAVPLAMATGFFAGM